MKKCIILCFCVDDYSSYDLVELTPEQRYDLCKANEGDSTKIVTVGTLCGYINDDMFSPLDFDDYFVYPYYVEEEEYQTYIK